MELDQRKLDLLRVLPPDQFEAARKMIVLGGLVSFQDTPAGPRLSLIGFEGEKFTDAEIPLLWPFRHVPLYSISFVNAKVSEASITRVLQEFPRLKSFCVTQMPIGDSALTPLAQFRDLEDVQFSSTKITSAILPSIGQQRGLRSLDLGKTAVDDAGIAHLESLSQLEWISLLDTKITSKSLATIGKLTNLEIMQLRGTQIDDEGLEHLTGLKRLRQFNLSRTKITNAGMVHIAQLTGLDKLTVTDTTVDADGIALLQNMPKLKEVHWLDEEKATLEQKRFHFRFHIYLPANLYRTKDAREKFERGELEIK